MAEPFIVAIPARLASTRLPGKLLLDLAGKPLISHTIDVALAAGAQEVLVATDAPEIADAVTACHDPAQVAVCMTRRDHSCGTDRLAEVASQRQWSAETIVVNIQGDEPLLPAALVGQVAQQLASDEQASVATLASPLDDPLELFNPACVKVVSNQQGRALYFSRAPLPWHRDAWPASGVVPTGIGKGWWRHIGIYAYRAGFLQRYTELPAGALEQLESLEQLRVLEHGFTIAVGLVEAHPAPGVDTAADLERVRTLLASASG